MSSIASHITVLPVIFLQLEIMDIVIIIRNVRGSYYSLNILWAKKSLKKFYLILPGQILEGAETFSNMGNRLRDITSIRRYYSSLRCFQRFSQGAVQYRDSLLWNGAFRIYWLHGINYHSHALTCLWWLQLHWWFKLQAFFLNVPNAHRTLDAVGPLLRNHDDKWRHLSRWSKVAWDKLLSDVKRFKD